MQMQMSVIDISRCNNNGIPESSTCLETLVARTAELLESLEREQRCRVQRRGYRRALPEFRRAMLQQVK